MSSIERNATWSGSESLTVFMILSPKPTNYQACNLASAIIHQKIDAGNYLKLMSGVVNRTLKPPSVEVEWSVEQVSRYFLDARNLGRQN